MLRHLFLFLSIASLAKALQFKQTLDSTMKIEWEILQDSIYFRFQCQISQGYCGLGLSRRMIDADMIIVTSLDNVVQVEDHYSTSHYIPPKDSILGGTQDLHYIEGGLDSRGHIDVFFYRKLVTGDEFDEEIKPNGLLEICWAHKNLADGIERHSDDDIGSAEIVFADTEEFLHFKRFGLDPFTKSHATHMSVSWGVSMTVAVIAARYFKWTSWWIYVHMVLASQVIISTIVSSATQFHYDQIFSTTMHDLQLFSSRLGFFIVALCAGQGLFGFLLLYVRWSGQNFQIVSFVTRAHKVVGWVLVVLGYSSIHLGEHYIGAELGFYYFMMFILIAFEFFSNLQMYFPSFRFYVRKIASMSHEEAFDLIHKGRLLMFADELIIDIQHFQYTHPGGKFMISEAVGEDTGKYLTGCSSYGGPFQPYSHSEVAFNTLKYLAVGKVPYPKGYLQSKSASLSQDSMEFLIFKQEMIAKNVWILTLKSEEFYMADLPMPEWLGKHFKIVHQTSRFNKVRRYYSSLFTDLAQWGRELGIEFPGEKECPGAVQIIYKAYEGGEMTQFLQKLPKGSPVEIQGPLGPGLMLSTLKGNYLAFAGGTGLIPFLDLLHLVWQNRSTLSDFSFTLYVFFRNEQESFCIDLLKKAQEHLPSFFFLRLIMTQTRKSFILEKEIELITRDDFNKVWLCGPSALNRRIYSSLDQNGFDKNKIILMNKMKVLVFILFIGGLGQYLPVKNKMNMAYFVPVGIGTPGQQVQLLVSSFSSVELIYVPALGLKGCGDDKEFNYPESKTFHLQTASFYQDYLIGNATGVLGDDTFSIESNEYYSIKSQSLLVGLEAKLPDNARCGMFSLGINSIKTNFSIVFNLFKQGRIPNLSYSLFLNDVGFSGNERYKTSSSIIFGGSDLGKYADNPRSGFRYHNLTTSSQVWAIEASSFSIGSSIISNKSETLILEPSFSFVGVPPAVYVSLIEKIGKKIICSKNETFFICPCKESYELPSLKFVIDKHEYSIPSKLYFKEEQDKCVLFVIQNKDSTWILGQIFLRRYYSYYDMRGRRVGLTESIYYKKGNHKFEKPISDEWLITILCLTTCVLVVFGVTLCWVYMKHKRPIRYSIMNSDSDYEIEFEEKQN